MNTRNTQLSLLVLIYSEIFKKHQKMKTLKNLITQKLRDNHPLLLCIQLQIIAINQLQMRTSKIYKK